MFTKFNWYKTAQGANLFVVQIANQINQLADGLKQIKDPRAQRIASLVEKLNIQLTEDAREYGMRMVAEAGDLWDQHLSNIPGIENTLPYFALRSIVNLGAQLS